MTEMQFLRFTSLFFYCDIRLDNQGCFAELEKAFNENIDSLKIIVSIDVLLTDMVKWFINVKLWNNWSNLGKFFYFLFLDIAFKF